MNAWRKLSSETALQHWNTWLLQLGNECIYQTYAWGQYKQALKQEQVRFIYSSGSSTETGMPQCMLQGHLRRFPLGFGMLWIPGGPAGDLRCLNRSTIKELKASLGVSHLLIRCSLLKETNPLDESALTSAGFRKSAAPIATGLSMYIDLPPEGIDALEKGSSNWRHNLRRGQKRIQAEKLHAPDAQEIAEAYRTLQETKGLSEQFSEAEVAQLIKSFGDDLTVYGHRSPEGKLLAFRACVCVGRMGWDLWAAATEDARKNYASHVLLSLLLQDCQRKGMKLYDLSGIDPTHATGVYNFKKGTGAREVRYVGEWELGPAWMSKLLAVYLNWKRRK